MDDIVKSKQIDIPGLHPLIASRWSPRAFSDKEIEPEKVTLLFEAARWSMSSYNEQPWNYIVGCKKNSKETYDKIVSTLVEFNQGWATNAPLLLISVGAHKFSKNGNDNPHYRYDCGQASAAISLQATHLGLFTHQMSGFDPAKAAQEFNIPEGYSAIAVMAVGYLGTLDVLPDFLKDYEKAPRQRKEVKDFVFSSKYGTPYNFN